MTPLDKKKVPFLDIIFQGSQSTFLNKGLGTAASDSHIVHPDSGTIKKRTENLSPSGLWIDIIPVGADGRISYDMDGETGRIPQGNQEKCRSNG